MSRVGERIGRFKLIAELGKGGMGVVYLAEDGQERVALKLLRARGTRRLLAFQREISVVRLLKHPGIVGLIESGVHKGMPWYAMEWLDGKPLSDFMYAAMGSGRSRETAAEPPRVLVSDTLMQTAPLALAHIGGPTQRGGRVGGAARPRGSARSEPIPTGLRKLLGFVGQLCRTLAYLHGRGMVHCDLKPANILVMGQRVVLIDFGLAVRMDVRLGADSLLNAGLAAGTAQYTCPERARGKEVDARSDLYAVGCILFELLTGRAPFTSQDAGQILYDQVHTSPPRPSELGVRIPAQLEELVMSLLEKTPRNRPGHAQVVVSALEELGVELGPDPAADMPPPAPYLFQSRFVGREGFTKRLCERVDEAMMGRGGVLMLVGPTGVGKTRQVVEVVRRVRPRTHTILHACGQPGSQERSMGLWAQILDTVAERCRLGGPQVVEKLLGDRAPLLAAYTPSLGFLVTEEDVLPRLSAAQGQEALFEAVFETLLALCGYRPALLILDDLHWADEMSLSCLQHIISRRLMDYPWLFLGSACPIQCPALAKLMANPSVERMALGSLEREFAQTIVADMMGTSQVPPGLVSFLIERCGGNPFSLGEYLRFFLAQGLLSRDDSGAWVLSTQELERVLNAGTVPNSLQSLIDGRVRGMEYDPRRLCQLLALMGRRVEFDTLPELTPLSEEKTEEALAEALQQGILSVTRDQLHFTNEAVRQRFLLDAEDDNTRRALHLTIATGLERLDGDLGEIAHHQACGGAHIKARETFLMATRQALDRYDTERARRFFKEALSRFSHDSHEALHLRCVFAKELLRANHHIEEAMRMLVEVVADARRLRAMGLLGEALLTLGTACLRQGNLEGAQRSWTEAMELAERHGNREVRSRVLLKLGTLFLRQGRLGKARNCFADARLSQPRGGTGLELSSRMATLVLAQGDLAEASRLLKTSLSATTAPLLRGRLQTQLSDVEVARGRLREAQHQLTQARLLLDSEDNLMGRAAVLMRQGRLQTQLGLLEEAQANLRLSLHLATQARSPLQAARARLFQAILHNVTGDLTTAVRNGEESLRVALAHGDRLLEIEARSCIGVSHTLDLRPRDAAPHLETALQLARSVESSAVAAEVQFALAQACAAADKQEAAGRWIQAALDAAQRCGMRGHQAAYERFHARWNRLRGDIVQARRALGRATTMVQRTGQVILRELCRCERGQLYLMCGQHTEAAMDLESAFQTFKRLELKSSSQLGQEVVELARGLERVVTDFGPAAGAGTKEGV